MRRRQRFVNRDHGRQCTRSVPVPAIGSIAPRSRPLLALYSPVEHDNMRTITLVAILPGRFHAVTSQLPVSIAAEDCARDFRHARAVRRLVVMVARRRGSPTIAHSYCAARSADLVRGSIAEVALGGGGAISRHIEASSICLIWATRRRAGRWYGGSAGGWRFRSKHPKAQLVRVLPQACSTPPSRGQAIGAHGRAARGAPEARRSRQPGGPVTVAALTPRGCRRCRRHLTRTVGPEAGRGSGRLSPPSSSSAQTNAGANRALPAGAARSRSRA